MSDKANIVEARKVHQRVLDTAETVQDEALKLRRAVEAAQLALMEEQEQSDRRQGERRQP